MQANRKASALRTVISDRLYTIVLSDVKFAIVFCTNLCKTVIVIVYFAKSLGIVLVIFAVAPFAGAWIEINSGSCPQAGHIVAPFAGAWIEMPSGRTVLTGVLSLPSRERGLKWH